MATVERKMVSSSDKRPGYLATERGLTSIDQVDDKKLRDERRFPRLLSPEVAATGAAVLLCYLLVLSVLGRLASGFWPGLYHGRFQSTPSRESQVQPLPLASTADGELTREQETTVAGSVTGSSIDEPSAVVPTVQDPSLRRNWTLEEVIENVAGADRSVIVVPVTSNYLDFTENFYISASRLGLGGKVLFVTVDDESWDYLEKLQPNQTVRVQGLGAPEPLRGNKAESQFNSEFFHSVVDRKPVYIRSLLERNVSVLFSDADIVLLGNPFLYFTGDYDIWLTKDADTFRDAFKLFPKDTPVPLNRKLITGDGEHMCSCFVYAKPTKGAKYIIDRWIKAIKDQVASTGKGIADQLMLNEVLTSSTQKQARVAVLPIQRFPSGCLFFGAMKKSCPIEHKLYQKALSQGKVTPLWAHNNWNKGHKRKLQLFIEHDLWFLSITKEVNRTEANRPPTEYELSLAKKKKKKQKKQNKSLQKD